MNPHAKTDTVAMLGSLAAVAVLVTGAVASPLVAAAAVGLVAMLILVLGFGLERTAVMVMAVAMFLAPMNKFRPVPGAGFATTSDVMFIIGFALLLPVLMRSRLRLPPAFVVGSMTLLATGLAASAFSALPEYSLNLMLRLTLAALGLPTLFMWWRPSLPTMARLGFAYLLGTSVSVGYGLLIGEDVGGRYLGLTTHTNYQGLSSTLALSLVPFLASTMHGRTRLVVYLCGMACLAGVWSSGSRAALLVVVALGLAFPVLERSLRAAMVVLAAITLALALSDRLLATTGSNALGRLLGDGAASAADEARNRALTAAWQAFQEHPILGNGFAQILEAHNIYLQVAVAAGIIGAVGFVLLLLPAVAPLVRHRGSLHLLGYPALAYLMLGLVQPNLWDRMIWGVLSLSYVATLTSSKIVRPRNPAPTKDVARR